VGGNLRVRGHLECRKRIDYMDWGGKTIPDQQLRGLRANADVLRLLVRGSVYHIRTVKRGELKRRTEGKKVWIRGGGGVGG